MYISTFHVYGTETGNIDEQSPLRPKTEYGLNHYLAEEYVKMFVRNNPIKGIIIRPTNIYGVPNDLETFNRWSLIPYSFCREIVDTNSITLRSDGSQMRNFVSAKTVARIIIESLKLDGPYNIVNASGADNYSVREFSKKVIGIYEMVTGKKAKLLAPKLTDKKIAQFLTVESKSSQGGESFLDDYLFEFINTLVGSKSER